MLEKYFGRADKADVVLSKRQGDFYSEVHIHIGKELQFKATGLARNAYQSLDVALRALAKQLRRNKRRLREDHPVKFDEGAASDSRASAATLDVFANASKSARFMTPNTFGWTLMRDAALSLALDHEFAGELANPRQFTAFTYADSPAVLPDDPAFETGPGAGAAGPAPPRRPARHWAGGAAGPPEYRPGGGARGAAIPRKGLWMGA